MGARLILRGKGNSRLRDCSKVLIVLLVSYVLPFLLHFLVYIVNGYSLKKFATFGMVLNSCGVLWEVTAVQVFYIFDYWIFCKKTQNRSPNKAIYLPISLSMLSFAVWVLGVMSTIKLLFEKYGESLFIAYFFSAISLICVTTISICVLKVVISRNKKYKHSEFNI